MRGRIVLIILFLTVSRNISFPQVTIEWASRYNYGYGDNAGLAVTTDDSGNVYVTGNSAGGLTRRDLIVLKYSSAGASIWTARIADTVNNNFLTGFDIKVDNFYNVYVGGSGMTKYDSDGKLLWRVPADSYRAIVLDSADNVYGTGGNSRYKTQKFREDGFLLWQAIYQNLDYNVARDLTLDRAGNVIMTGQCSHTAGTTKYVTIKYSGSGNTIWLREYYRQGSNGAYAITSDNSSNVYVTGRSQFASVDAVTIKYSPEGDTLWTAIYDSGGGDAGYDIETDSLGNVYVAGLTAGGNYITLKYDVEGNLLWSRIQTYGDISPQLPKLKLDKNNNVYMSFVTRRPGNFDNYAVVKYNSDGVQQWVAEYFVAGFNYIYDLALDFQANIYVTGISGISIATVKFVQAPMTVKQINSSHPEKYALNQNYPNPFNPTTIINFSIPKQGFVSLKVYDILGKEAMTLINEQRQGGNYEVEFKANNLPSGIYFYRLVSGEFNDVKRMVLLK